ncbi:MAG: ArsR/SmtB family transcription factor [Candidatus Hermodarchaeota archaeon]
MEEKKVSLMKQKRTIEIKNILCARDNCSNSNAYFEKLLELGKNLEENENLDMIERFTSAISSKERLIIINALKEKDRCVCELEAILNKSQSTISHHLRKLVSASLIQGYKKQKFTYYHLFKEELEQNINVLNEILAY